MKLSQEQIVNKAYDIYGHLFDFKYGIYFGIKENIDIFCKHGKFTTTMSDHLHKNKYCGECKKEYKYKKAKKLITEKIAEASIIHNNFYDYSEVFFLNAKDKAKIICPIHGMFEQIFYDHLRGYGCRLCGNIVIGEKIKLTYEDILNKLSERKGRHIYNYTREWFDKYYDGINCKMPFTCPIHGEFFQEIYLHIQGHDCRMCFFEQSKINSKSERLWLDICNIPRQYRQFKIQLGNKTIFVDGFDPNTNTVYEFYGDYWHGNPNIFNSLDMNVSSKISFGDLYQRTIQREELIKSAGYNLITIWENDFRKLLSQEIAQTPTEIV